MVIAEQMKKAVTIRDDEGKQRRAIEIDMSQVEDCPIGLFEIQKEMLIAMEANALGLEGKKVTGFMRRLESEVDSASLRICTTSRFQIPAVSFPAFLPLQIK